MPDKMLGLLRILSGSFISEAYVEAGGNFALLICWRVLWLIKILH